MKYNSHEIKSNERPLSLIQFLESFNKNMPPNFMQATKELLLKFRKEHESLFRKDNSWSLDHHRKKLIDWLPRNSDNT
ncbi:MAG: hypothetical protein JW740_00770 [Candidatus Zambryskibacteria bacterium]|nr:hypothetical protein [Candidatus Zambryskibacteria bacterium]